MSSRHGTRRRFLVSLALSASAAAWAAAPLQCPGLASLPAPNQAADAAGWTMHLGSVHAPLTGLSIYDGPPDQGAALKPAIIASNAERIVWRLSAMASPPAWLSCDYAGGLYRMSRPLPADVQRCEAVIRRLASPTRLDIVVRCD